jgi:hypothetical protein
METYRLPSGGTKFILTSMDKVRTAAQLQPAIFDISLAATAILLLQRSLLIIIRFADDTNAENILRNDRR